MVLRCLAWTVAHTDADWVVLLSGQDYPVRPLAEVEARLAAARVDGFITARPVPRPRSRVPDEPARRYHHRWWGAAWAPAPAVRAAARARPLVQVVEMPDGPRIGVPAVPSPFGRGLVCHHGADWWSLSRRAAAAVGRSAGERPGLLRHFLRTLHPTEAYVHTVLANEPGLELSGDTRRLSRWESGAQRPRTLTVDDLGLLGDPAFDFARKFDERVDADVLDALDRRVLGRS